MSPKICILRIAVLILIFGTFMVCSNSSTSGSERSTITPNQSLADGDILVSPGGIFALGFFQPGNSDRRYVGIWFHKAPEQSVVWVANRNNPIRDASGILSFDGTQNLILSSSSSSSNSSKSPVWSTNISSPTINSGTYNNYSVEAKLLDIGNFVLLNVETHRVIWQSFNYPTDTVLTFMKIGWERQTRVNRMLTSWKSKDDPGTGSCSYGVDRTGVSQMTLNVGPNKLWRGGPWNGLRFSGIPEQRNNVLNNINYIDSPDEVSITTTSVINSSLRIRTVLYETGSIQAFTWKPGDERWFMLWSAPKDLCDSYGRCGPYSYCDPNFNTVEFECKCLPGFKPRSVHDWDNGEGKGGCVRERGQDHSGCENGAGFVRLAHVKLPDTRVARKNMSLSGEACEEECLRNCTCVAYTSAILTKEGGESGCITWYGDLMDIKLYPKEGQDLYIRVDAVELENARKMAKGSHGAKTIQEIIIVPALLVALFSILLCYWLSKLRGRAKRRKLHKLSLLDLASTHKSNVEYNEVEEGHKISLPFFNLKELKYATNDFSNKLGQGGFGAVYWGLLPNGQEIAVKRLSKHSGQGVEEFKNEVSLIARLQHRNLVKLLGYCINEEETMLIYEYMPNKSLDSFIFDDSKKVQLDWKRRYEIIVGIARGMLYLHQDSRLRIIHRDLKTSNILLDAKMIPKISDFGMARIFTANQSEANTTRVVGTYGYMSPEYALDGLFSIKSDVFSFGVILLEIISGKRNHSSYNNNPLLNLIRYSWDLWMEGKALEIVDTSMSNSWQEIEVLRCVQVGLLCVQENVDDRPTMSTIVFMLSNEVSLPSPKRPGFAIRRINGSNNTGSFASGSSLRLNSNEVTMSMLEPR